MMALRHQTLRATLEWSYDLLTSSEQRLLSRLSMFAGSWTLDAAEAVGADRAGIADALIDVLACLVDKSLVIVEDNDDETRYRMLQPTREYAFERLTASGDSEATARAHACFYHAFAQQAAEGLRGRYQQRWTRRVGRELDNVRAALRWTLTNNEVEWGLSIAASLCHFWQKHGHLSEGRQWLDQLLAMDGNVSDTVSAHALDSAGLLAYTQDAYDKAIDLFEHSLVLYQRTENEAGIATVCEHLGKVALSQGKYDQAASYLHESKERATASGNTAIVAATCIALAVVYGRQGQTNQAIPLLEQSAKLYRELGDTRGVGAALGNLGWAALSEGDYERAKALLEESLALTRDVNNQGNLAWLLMSLGRVALEQGDHAQAAVRFQESLPIVKMNGDQERMAYCLEGLAASISTQGGATQAARLIGAAQVIRETIGAPVPPADRQMYEQLLATTRKQLDEAVLNAALTAGRTLPPDDVLTLALRGKPLVRATVLAAAS